MESENMPDAQVTQNEIDDLVQEAEQKINNIINLLEFYNANFNSYEWNDNRPTNHEHLQTRLITWIDKFSTYSVDPTKISMNGFQHLDPLYVQRMKLRPFIEFLEFTEENLDPNIVQNCNDSLLNSLGNIINRYANSNGFIPQ